MDTSPPTYQFGPMHLTGVLCSALGVVLIGDQRFRFGVFEEGVPEIFGSKKLRLRPAAVFFGVSGGVRRRSGRGDEVCALDEALMAGAVGSVDVLAELLPPALDGILLERTLPAESGELVLQLAAGGLLLLDDGGELPDLGLVETAERGLPLLQASQLASQFVPAALEVQRSGVVFALRLPEGGREQVVLVLGACGHIKQPVQCILYCFEKSAFEPIGCLRVSSLRFLLGWARRLRVQWWNQLEHYKMINSKMHSALAVPFITYQEGVGFALSKEAEEFLLSLPEERELGIVSIVGKYRTGKSFFVNRVLLDQKKGGFQVGPTINPCTKGLWLWKRTLASSTNPKMDIIMIDTEGFGGMDENANHDSRIFLFSLLLSSYFIYNSVGSIDENALNTLNLIINLAKDIQTKANGRPEADPNSFPAFLWVVRDFTLMLQDKNGNKINSEQYLENALEVQKGSSDAIENKNKIRRLLKSFFQDRDCELMVRPTEREKDLQRLDEIDNSSLRPEFVAQVEAIRSKIFSRVRAKKVNDKALNGQLLVALCKGYMEAINKGALPNVESAWFYVCRSEGLRAIKEATELLDSEVKELLQKPIRHGDIAALRNELREKVLAKFKKRSLNSEESHPDLMEKLEKRLEEGLGDLLKRNRNLWEERYTAATEQITEHVKQKIYNDEYEDFSDFVRDFEQVKEDYDQQTHEGDPVEKWKYFNEISEHLYRLAGETITTKINKNLHHEKALMQQRLQRQEEELETQQRQLEDEKDALRSKLAALEKENAKVAALEDSHKTRALQYKTEHDKLYEKYRQLFNDHEELTIQLDKLKREHKRIAETEVEETRNELLSIRNTLDKERALHDMEKKYMEEEIERYKDRASTLDAETRKLRAANAKLASEAEEQENRYEEKRQEAEILEQANASFSKKIEQLIAENSKKSELMSDHSEWLLEKSYLENQVAFLKNTLNENKRLHDALLVALQQSLATTDSEANADLLEANKNLSAALEKMEGRCKVLEEKHERVRDFKRMMKNCQALQCLGCSKWIQRDSFAPHTEQCCTNSTASLREKTAPEFNREAVHVAVSQTVIREAEGRKPYTEYVVQLGAGEARWRVGRRYKEFTELQQMLILRFPSIRYPPSCNFLADINNLVAGKQRNLMAEERRKSLQQYLRDLLKIDEIRNSDILRKFLEFPETKQPSEKKEKHL